MGRIANLRKITKARIDAFLNSIERPERILPQLEKEMSQKVAEAAKAEAKALAAVRGAQRRVDEAAGRAMRLEKGVKQAITAGDMETARRAVAALVEAEKDTEHLRAALDTAHTAYLDAGAVRKQLADTLNDLKARRKDIIDRSRRVELQKAIQTNRALGIADGTEILDVVARMEARLDHDETLIEAANHLRPTLDLTLDSDILKQRLHDAEVEARLAELKAKYMPPANGE
jgi:phage shock protein A